MTTSSGVVPRWRWLVDRLFGLTPAQAQGQARDLKILLLALIALSAFGPYIIPAAGLRTEHLLIYAQIPLAVIWHVLRRGRPLRSRHLAWSLFMLFLLAALLCILSTALNPRYSPSVYSVLAALQHFLQPMAILLIGLALTQGFNPHDLEDAWRLVTYAVLALLVLNAFIEVYSIFRGVPQLVLNYWQPPDSPEGANSVMANTIDMSRFTGIFNQTHENGACYSLGLFLWGLHAIRRPRIGLFAMSVLGCLLVGGAISVSKIFLLGGIPLFIIYLGWFGGFRKLMAWKPLTVLALAMASIVTYAARWEGLDYLLRFFSESERSKTGILSLLTAGRFSGSGQGETADLWRWVWSQSPVFGTGLASYTPLDSGYMEFYVQGGLLALSVYFLILFSLSSLGRPFPRKSPRKAFGLLLFLFLFVSSLGAPVLTLNRFSTILWIYIILLIQFTRFDQVSG